MPSNYDYNPASSLPPLPPPSGGTGKQTRRIAALSAAAIVFEGKGTGYNDIVVSAAKRFEEYLETGE
jgi:hypothetical protein